MFHQNAAEIASRLLATNLPKGSDEVIQSFIANPNDGALNLLEAAFQVPSRLIVELKQLRDDFSPPVSSELRARYKEAFDNLVGSVQFTPEKVRAYLQICLELLSADRGGEIYTGLEPVIGMGFKAARLSIMLTQKQAARDFSLSIGAIGSLESGCAGDMIFQKAQNYLNYILAPGENVKWRAVSFLLGQSTQYCKLHEFMRKTYGD